MKKKKPVRAVIDTNLFVSDLFAAQGYSYQVLQLWVAGAFEVKADYIVSGDNHLLELKHFHGIQNVDAKALVETVTAK